jgi:hypothetical protein
MINGHIKIGYIQINIKNIKIIKNINFKKYIKYIYIKNSDSESMLIK